MEKPKKKISLSKQIKILREKLKRSEKRYWELWQTYRKLRDQLNSIEKILPMKYFKIEFKIKAEDEYIYTYEEMIKEYTLQTAIDKLLDDKLHPESFELIDVKVLG